MTKFVLMQLDKGHFAIPSLLICWDQPYLFCINAVYYLIPELIIGCFVLSID